MGININDIARTLDACVRGRFAIEAAVQVYEDARILVDTALHAHELAEAALRNAAQAAEDQLNQKIQAAIDLEQGLEDLIGAVRSSRNIKKRNALDTCIAARQAIDLTAQRVERLKTAADAATDLHSIAQEALAAASNTLTEKKRVYDDAVNSASAAKGMILNISRYRP